MPNLVRILKWPIISWIVVDVVFLVASYTEGIVEMMTPAVLTPLALAFGVWVGYKTISFGGNYGHAILSGVIVGAVCAVLTVVGFGAIRGLGVDVIMPLGLFTFGMNVAGATIGAGFALTK